VEALKSLWKYIALKFAKLANFSRVRSADKLPFIYSSVLSIVLRLLLFGANFILCVVFLFNKYTSFRIIFDDENKIILKAYKGSEF